MLIGVKSSNLSIGFVPKIMICKFNFFRVHTHLKFVLLPALFFLDFDLISIL